MTTEVQLKDVAGVRSRVSWGAILGGAMTSIAVFFLLSVLGTAIGATVLYRAGDTDISMGAAIWAVITMVLALFCGGCVASQCTAGENKEESIMYGVMLWGTIFTILLFLTATGMNAGFAGVMGASIGSNQAASSGQLTEQQLRTAGVSDEAIRNLRKDHANSFRADNVQQQGENAQEKAREIAQSPRTVSAAWWTFGGILLSMLAAISGSLTGAGPNFRLVNLGFNRVLANDHGRPGTARTAV